MTAPHPLLVVSSEFPPATGGVGDYCVQWLAGVLGDPPAEPPLVLVSAPGSRSADHARPSGVAVVEVPSWGVRSTVAAVRRARRSGVRTALVHYVPQMYHRRGLPLGVALLPLALRASGVRVVTLFHELWVDTPGWRGRLGRTAQRALVLLLALGSHEAVVTIPRREAQLRAVLRGRGPRVTRIPVSPSLPVTPVPAPTRADDDPVRLLHFGFGHPSKDLDRLRGALDELDRRGLRHVATVAGSVTLDDPRVRALGPCTPERLVAEIGAAELVLLPFVDGASSRRSSLVNSLVVGRAVVSTVGPDTDVDWFDGAVVLVDGGVAEYAAAVADLVADAGARAAQADRAARWSAATVAWTATAPTWRRLLDGG